MLQLDLFHYVNTVQKLNQFLTKNEEYINEVSTKKLKKMIDWVLNQEFEPNNSFFIFDYIEEYNDRIEEYFDDTILINSHYFKTMPDSLAIKALIEYISLSCELDSDEFAKHLITRIKAEDLLNYSSLVLAELVDYYNNLGLEEKILELHNTDLIAMIADQVEYECFIKKIHPDLTLEEKKAVSLNKNITAYEAFSILFNWNEMMSEEEAEFHRNILNKDEVDVLFDVIMERGNLEEAGPIIQIPSGHHLTFYEKMLYIIKTSSNFSEQDRNYFIEKLIASNDQKKMYLWLANIDCEESKKIIDYLMKVGYPALLFSSIHKDLIPYAMDKYFEEYQETIDTKKFNYIFPIDLAIYDDSRLNMILDAMFNKKPDIQFSKNTTICLLERGVYKFPILIQNITLTKEEREEILGALNIHNSPFSYIYGAYLLSGEEEKKLKSENVEIELRKILERNRKK